MIKPDYAVVHDISFIRCPKSYSKSFRLMYRIGYRLTLKRCMGIVTVSQFCRDELRKYYGLNGRIVVAGASAEEFIENEAETEAFAEGVIENEAETEASAEELSENRDETGTLAEEYSENRIAIGLSETKSAGGQKLRKSFENDCQKRRVIKRASSGQKYYLAVGSLNLHKNQAFIEKLAEKYPDRKFVIVGESGGKTFAAKRKKCSGMMLFWKRMKVRGSSFSEKEKGISGERDIIANKHLPNLIYTGYVTDEELKALYEGAQGFIFPSLYEGFGIPPMEAIMCGVRRIALADIQALREIYTKGCFFFDPEDVESFDIADFENKADNITDEICEYYRKKYTWRSSAEKILEGLWKK